MVADVHDENIARHRHRDAGFLEVEKGEGGRLAVVVEEKADGEVRGDKRRVHRHHPRVHHHVVDHHLGVGPIDE